MRTTRHLKVSLIIIATMVSRTAVVAADDAFFDIPLSELKIISGELPKSAIATDSFRFGPRAMLMYYRAALDGEGEAYLNIGPEQQLAFQYQATDDLSTCHLLIRAPRGKDVTGKLALPSPSSDKMTLVSFSIPAAKANDSAQERFWQDKWEFYVRLAELPTVPGTAWFRRQVNDAMLHANDLGRKQGKSEPRLRITPNADRTIDSYELFSGGRAISESLQLDRLLREPSQDGQPTIDINTLKGITVAEIDWKPLLKGANPKLDPLASDIPADQHAVFFPSFAAVTKFVDETQGRSTDVFKFVTPKSEDANLLGRYERQLGLSLSSLGRALGTSDNSQRGCHWFRSILSHRNRCSSTVRNRSASGSGLGTASANSIGGGERACGQAATRRNRRDRLSRHAVAGSAIVHVRSPTARCGRRDEFTGPTWTDGENRQGGAADRLAR